MSAEEIAAKKNLRGWEVLPFETNDKKIGVRVEQLIAQKLCNPHHHVEICGVNCVKRVLSTSFSTIVCKT